MKSQKVIEKQPITNKIRHLDNDNIDFVLSLRGDNLDSQSTPTKASLPVRHITKSHDNHHCKHPLCQQVEVDLTNQIHDKEELAYRLEELSEYILEKEQLVVSLEREKEQLIQKQHNLLTQLQQLDQDFYQQKQIYAEKQNDRMILQKKIKIFQQELFRMKQQHQSNNKSPSCHPQTLANPHNSLHNKQFLSPKTKHNGNYGRLLNVKPQWSCCLAEDYDARGCIEEHSIGIKSQLPIPTLLPSPQTKKYTQTISPNASSPNIKSTTISPITTQMSPPPTKSEITTNEIPFFVSKFRGMISPQKLLNKSNVSTIEQANKHFLPPNSTTLSYSASQVFPSSPHLMNKSMGNRPNTSHSSPHHNHNHHNNHHNHSTHCSHNHLSYQMVSSASQHKFASLANLSSFKANDEPLNSSKHVRPHTASSYFK